MMGWDCPDCGRYMYSYYMGVYCQECLSVYAVCPISESQYDEYSEKLVKVIDQYLDNNPNYILRRSEKHFHIIETKESYKIFNLFHIDKRDKHEWTLETRVKYHAFIKL